MKIGLLLSNDRPYFLMIKRANPLAGFDCSFSIGSLYNPGIRHENIITLLAPGNNLIVHTEDGLTASNTVRAKFNYLILNLIKSLC